jgi:hypothetical protein
MNKRIADFKAMHFKLGRCYGACPQSKIYQKETQYFDQRLHYFAEKLDFGKDCIPLHVEFLDIHAVLNREDVSVVS